MQTREFHLIEVKKFLYELSNECLDIKLIWIHGYRSVRENEKTNKSVKANARNINVTNLNVP